MNERRNNWKENLSKEAQRRHAKKMKLLSRLDSIRKEWRECGVDFAKRDELSLKYRVTVAELATL